ncbi:MAG: DUF2690 domain-containing protein [Thermoleophilia bacterium]
MIVALGFRGGVRRRAVSAAAVALLTGAIVGTVPAQAASTLGVNQTLQSGQSLWSQDGRYRFVMQGDGNLVEYGPAGVVWNSRTDGNSGSVAIMQGDGNLVVYAPGSRPVWSSGTAGRGTSTLTVQNDGNTVVYGPNGATWSVYTGVIAPRPAPSVGCYGDYCSGKDATATGCDRDAVTVAWRDITAARLELRWSPTCKTNWARYIQYPRGWYVGNVPLVLRAKQDTGYTQSLSYGVNGTGTGTTWSPMIYSPVRLVRAELVVSCGGAGDCATSALTGENPIVTAWK